MNKEIVIKCPKCGREYLPCEIYLPDYFLGKAPVVSRDLKGHIDFYAGSNMDLTEEFTCRCGASFKVQAKVEFETILNKEEEEGYISVDPDD